MPPRHGKLIADSLPVLTPDGWSTHGQLKVGGQVFGPDGIPATITAVSKPELATVDVVTTTGAVITCHRLHEWTLFDRGAGYYRTVETRELFEPSERTGMPVKLWSGQPGSRGAHCRFKLPPIEALQFAPASLPIDPYTLGIWLGDGSETKTQITMSAEDFEAVVPAIEAGGYEVSAKWVHPATGVPTISLGGRKGSVGGPFRLGLVSLGLIGNKRIPPEYQRGSVDQRLALLAGLIDSDGHVEKSTGRVRFVTTRPALRDDVYELTTTLGFRPYVTSQAAATSSSGIVGRSDVFTVGFQPTMAVPTRVPRKRIDRLVKQRMIGIAEVRPSASPEMGRCIEVDRRDGLYLVGRDLIPTHNSLLASEHFPAFYLGNNPDRSVIAMTYGQELANDFGRSVRNQMLDPFYQAVFPGVFLRKDSKASHRFNTPQRGAYFAAGRNASITGRGAHLFLVDDPIKNMEEADSDIIRRKVSATSESVVLTRLQKGGAIVLIQTRWHQDDLAGHVLKHHKHDKWRVLELPAINAKGEALWEEEFPARELLRRKASLSARVWSALYQQRPTSDEGAILLRKYWRPWTDPVPEAPTMIIISLDTAYTERSHNDPSAFTVWYVIDTPYVHRPLAPGERPPTPDMRVKLLLRYAWRDRLEFPDLIETMVDAVDTFTMPDIPFRLLVEDKAAGLSVIQEMRRRMPGLNLHVAKAAASKVARAHSVTAMMEAGRVYALARQQREGDDPDAPLADVFMPWATMCIDECAAFPVGAHDDLVDTVTHALRHIRDSGVELFAEDAPDPTAAVHDTGPLY